MSGAGDAPRAADDADRQLPRGAEIFLDHVGHFVADIEHAADALSRAGFAPTPPSIQANPDPGGGEPRPTGTGNITAMLPRGYIEVLFKTADTPLGREFDAAMARYPGLHVAAFAVPDAAAAHRRLAASGFRLRPLVSMQRPVGTVSGAATAAFTIARLEPGEMPEGRVQMLTHHTEDAVWQPRWLTHRNGATALLDVVIAVTDVEEAAARFARFVGREATAAKHGSVVRLDRGRIVLVDAQGFAAQFPEVAIPALPFIGAYAVKVERLEALEAILHAGGLAYRRSGRAVVVPFPPELGIGAWMFVERADDLPWRIG